MSTASPFEARMAFSWADNNSEPDTDTLRKADLIPRSVQQGLRVGNLYQQGSTRKQLHHYDSQSSPALDTAGYDKLNIDISINPYASSSLSMSRTHEHGKVQEIIARFESCAGGKHSIGPSLTIRL
jgi:hypothetical protein